MPNSNITIVITLYDSYMIIAYMAPITHSSTSLVCVWLGKAARHCDDDASQGAVPRRVGVHGIVPHPCSTSLFTMASYVMTIATLAYIHRLFTEVKLQPATAGAEETEEQSEAVAETEDTSSWADWDTVEQQSRRESREVGFR